MNYRTIAIALIFCLFVGCASTGRHSAGGYGGGNEEAEDTSSIFDFL